MIAAAAEALARDLAGLAEAEERFRDEVTLIIPRERLLDVLARARDAGFAALTDLTAVDRLPQQPRFEVVYLLTNYAASARVRLKVRVDADDALVPSVESSYPGANWLEREVFDMFGIRFSGHPDLKRILMPDDWEGHPLRKDFPLVEEPVDFTGHTPKVPSAIIPKTPRTPPTPPR
ncbi:MAG TPA: NADH-quinone oxidoreductase subunit C [bacterium]|nr:NADH-quinone oxidoreductase subunit C [bacterium]